MLGEVPHRSLTPQAAYSSTSRRVVGRGPVSCEIRQPAEFRIHTRCCLCRECTSGDAHNLQAAIQYFLNDSTRPLCEAVHCQSSLGSPYQRPLAP